MKTELTDQSNKTATLKVKMDRDALGPIRLNTYERLRRSVKAAGFRPGKAPDAVVERELGQQAVQSEVLEEAVNHSYAAAVQEHDLPVIAPPEVQISKFVPYDELEYEAKVEIMPPIKLADYKKLGVKPEKAEVGDEEVDKTIEDLRRRLATTKNIDRAAKDGDEVVFDFDGKLNGQPVAGASAKKQTLLLGSGSFIPGFEKNLIGLKPEEEKTFTVTFPKDYHQKDLAGQPVEFSVKVHEVHEVELPKLDEGFASQIGPYKTVDELKKDIRDRIHKEKESEARHGFEHKLLEKLIEKSQLDIPERLTRRQLDQLKAEFNQRLAQSGLDIEKYLQMAGKSQDEFEKELRPQAEQRVAQALVLQEVAKTESITVESEELEQELDQLRARYQDEQMQAQLSDPAVLEDLRNHLLAQKTLDKLISFNQ